MNICFHNRLLYYTTEISYTLGFILKSETRITEKRSVNFLLNVRSYNLCSASALPEHQVNVSIFSSVSFVILCENGIEFEAKPWVSPDGVQELHNACNREKLKTGLKVKLQMLRMSVSDWTEISVKAQNQHAALKYTYSTGRNYLYSLFSLIKWIEVKVTAMWTSALWNHLNNQPAASDSTANHNYTHTYSLYTKCLFFPSVSTLW